MPSAAFGYMGIGVETTPGTSVAPTKFVPVKSVNFDVQQDEIRFREIAGSRQAQQSFGGSIRPSVTFDTAFYPVGASGVIFRGLFGAVTSAAGAGTTPTSVVHTFADAATLPSLSFERSDTATEGTGVLHERIPGCKIESVSFTAEFGAEINMSVTAQGLSFPENPATKPTVTLPSVNPLIFTGVSVSLDGVASDLFKSINFDFNNTLEPQEALRGTRTAYKIHEGPLECTLNGTMIFEDNSIYNKFRDATTFSVAAKFTSSELADATNNVPYSAEFIWSKVKVLNFDVNMEAEGVMEADVEFSVSYDRVNKRFVQVKLTNTDAAGTYDT